MRAFVITAPGKGEVQEVAEPVATEGLVVVQVERAGLCGTDMEFFSGAMSYLDEGHATYPMRIGHEWCGTVVDVGPGVDSGWLGRRVTGDTMLGCRHCERCRSGRQHLCADRYEIGVRRGWPGALAARLPVPEWALYPLPDSVDVTMGAMIEPGGNALRAVRAAGLTPGERLLVLGPGTIGLLAAFIAAAQGAEVHVLGLSTDFARSVGITNAWTVDDLPELRWDAVIDASTGAELPALAARLVEPGRRVVYIGISEQPSPVDSRWFVLKDITAVGVLSASGGLAGAIELYASGAVDPRPLVGATVRLDEVVDILARRWHPPAPKVLVNPASS
ncbi:MAG TPA: alcohol dehydrogenase catalytic domain-containing protein [Actinoplanes sp.]